MPPIPFQNLGDEPLYCEAVHNEADSDFYSGSEDDHYIAPLHRRLHIEKKAVEFLSGEVPILVSASLRGPFDRAKWNNPWRSRRAELCAGLQYTEHTQSRHTFSGDENLPNTQGTSLYPLPSPGITNPPSARKNPYMDTKDYSRIKTWRESVKSVSVFKDPFWQSQQDGGDDGDDGDDEVLPMKRSANPAWLHKREPKKQKFAGPKSNTPDDSPSRIVGRHKKNQLRKLSASQAAKQSMRDYSSREDELAADERTGFHNFIPPGITNRSTGLPTLLPIERSTPRRKTRFRHDAETSEDELSMPATTPTSNSVRRSATISKSQIGDRSPSRRAKAVKSTPQSLSESGKFDPGRVKFNKQQPPRLGNSRRLGADGANTSPQMAAQMAAATVERMNKGSDRLLRRQPEKVRGELPPKVTVVAKSMALTEVLVGGPSSTQHDNSFCFHKRASSPEERAEDGPLTVGLLHGTALSLSKLQVQGVAEEKTGSCILVEDSTASFEALSAGQMTEDSRQTQKCTIRTGGPANSSATAEYPAFRNNTADDRPQETDRIKTDHRLKTVNGNPAETEPLAADESMQVGGLQATNEPETLEETKMDVCVQSDSEWSTYLDSQALPPASSGIEEATENADDIPVMECGVDGLSDPDWSTFINTQDNMYLIPSREASVNQEELTAHVFYKGSGVRLEPERAALAKVSISPSVSAREVESTHETVVVSCVKAPSLVHATLSGAARFEATPVRVSQQATHSEAFVGSIVDRHADIYHREMNCHIDPTVTVAGANGTELPKAELTQTGETITSCSSFPDLGLTFTTGSVDNPVIPNQTPGNLEPQQSQSPLQVPVSEEIQSSLVSDSSRPDESMFISGTGHENDLSGINSQIPQATLSSSDRNIDAAVFDETTASFNEPEPQRPWAEEAGTSLQVPLPGSGADERLSMGDGVIDETSMQIQSPWDTKAGTASHPPFVSENRTSPIGSPSKLNFLAGGALVMSQLPQSPWMAQNSSNSKLPTPELTVPIRAFSDFMTPSPSKKRASFNGSILQSSSARPRLLFKTSGTQKRNRRVHFAPLCDEQETHSAEPDTDLTDNFCIEEDASYFDASGQKTGIVRLPKPKKRAISPPPPEMTSVEAGVLSGQYHKFAKHFEAMSKRKTPNRKTLRLLPCDSQQTISASQGVGAMAEAFIYASQTRRKGVELAVEEMDDTGHKDVSIDKIFSPVATSSSEDQENTEPVDDVSAVLDNLEDFLDKTWGIEMGVGDSSVNETWAHQQTMFAPGESAMQNDRHPTLSLEANVWAE